ncbi:hypothetical protein D3C81_1673020 [compost metagenome]
MSRLYPECVSHHIDQMRFRGIPIQRQISRFLSTTSTELVEFDFPQTLVSLPFPPWQETVPYLYAFPFSIGNILLDLGAARAFPPRAPFPPNGTEES